MTDRSLDAMRKGALAALFCFLAIAFPAHADRLTGKVVKVIDGDTIDLLVDGRETHRVRLAGIDCPEKRGGQPFWRAAREALSDAVAGKTATIDWHKKDRWQRLIGIVLLDGHDQNLVLIEKGLCWHFKRYQNEQRALDRDRYGVAEDEARAGGIGLWQEPDPVPPWEWRRR